MNPTSDKPDTPQERKEQLCLVCFQFYTEPSFGGFGICGRCDTGIAPDGHKYTYNEILHQGRVRKHIDQLLQQARSDAIGEARKQVAGEIFNLAHKYAQDDKTMMGAEQLRAYHYYNAIHKIGDFSGR